MIPILYGNSEQLCTDDEKKVFSEENSINFETNALTRLNDRDHSKLAHLFLNYHVI